MGNFVFIATSVDGFIAKEDDNLDWLMKYNDPDGSDYGYKEFINNIDAIVLGRGTYDFVNKMEPWYYTKPVYVVSSSLNAKEINKNVEEVFSKSPKEIVRYLNGKGYNNLYIDGGKTISYFLDEDLIDELIISKVPIILGSGIPLFNKIKSEIELIHIDTVVYKNGLVKSHYKRKR